MSGRSDPLRFVAIARAHARARAEAQVCTALKALSRARARRVQAREALDAIGARVDRDWVSEPDARRLSLDRAGLETAMSAARHRSEQADAEVDAAAQTLAAARRLVVETRASEEAVCRSRAAQRQRAELERARAEEEEGDW